MSEMKPTLGPWEAKPTGPWDGWDGWSVEDADGSVVCDAHGSQFDGRREANARLIAEAGTVSHNTGLSPVQLVEQRDGLASLLREIYDMARQGALPNSGDEWFDLTSAALAKCEGVKE